MNWYQISKLSSRFPEPSKEWFGDGAIFGYTRTDNLKSRSVKLSPQIAATWGSKNGISHEEVFGLMQQEIDVFTWIYDIGRNKLDGVGFDFIPQKVKSAAWAEVKARL